LTVNRATVSPSFVAVDPQKQAKMLAQFRRRFHKGGNWEQAPFLRCEKRGKLPVDRNRVVFPAIRCWRLRCLVQVPKNTQPNWNVASKVSFGSTA